MFPRGRYARTLLDLLSVSRWTQTGPVQMAPSSLWICAKCTANLVVNAVVQTETTKAPTTNKSTTL